MSETKEQKTDRLLYKAHHQTVTRKAYFEALRSLATLGQYTNQPQWVIDRLWNLVREIEAKSNPLEDN